MKEISKEDLLKYAKEKYPIGTKFKSLLDEGVIRSVEKGNYYKESNGDIVADGNYVYRKMIWVTKLYNSINEKNI